MILVGGPSEHTRRAVHESVASLSVGGSLKRCAADNLHNQQPVRTGRPE